MDRLWLILFIAILCSCSTFRQDELADRIQIEYKRDFENIDSILQVNKIIQLKCTTPESAVNAVRKVLFLKDRIVVADSKRLLLFDYDGNFIKSTGSMVGKGHNEYIEYIDVALDTYNNEIYLCANNPRKMFVFDSELNLKRVQEYMTRMMEIAVDEHYLYYLTLSDAQDEYGLECVDKTNIEGNATKLASTKQVCAGLFTNGMSLSNNGECYACLPFDNRIYELNGGKITMTYNIDNDSRWYNSSGGDARMSVSDFLREYEGKEWNLKDFYVLDSVMFFTSSSSNFYVIDFKHNTGVEYEGRYSIKYPILGHFFIPFEGLPNSIVFSVSRYDLSQHKQKLEDGSEEVKDMSSEATRIIKDYDEADNPIILVWGLKAGQHNKSD